MAAGKTSYTVVSPLTGKTYTRKSGREYTHAVFATSTNNGADVEDVSFCRTEALAQARKFPAWYNVTKTAIAPVSAEAR